MALTARPKRHDSAAKAKIMADVVADADRPKRMNVDIDADIHRQIKARAAQEGRTISEITRELWLDYLTK